MISTTAKEAIKMALAITITYGIALQMNWDKPMWASMVVVLISLSTIGQSLNKAAMRMFGTLVGGIVALLILAISIQDRWLFMFLLTSWVGFCCYMMGGKQHPYFWHVCGLVSIIVTIEGGTDSANVFSTAILRAEETALGILVYSLVALLLWPSNSKASFEAVAHKRASSQYQLFQDYLGMMNNTGSDNDAHDIRMKLMQEQTQFNQLLDAAVSDSPDIAELAPQWRRYQSQALQLSDSLERWRESFAEVEMLNLQRMIPNLAVFSAELDQRLIQIDHMLDNQVLDHSPKAVELLINPREIHGLRQFEKAALEVTKNRLLELDALTLSLFNGVSEIKGFIPLQEITESGKRAVFELNFPDPERIAAMIRVVVTLWIAYLVVIYVNGIPGGSSFVIISGSLVLAFSYLPQVPVSILFKPVAISLLFATILYVFVMPKLSTFLELGSMLFLVTFSLQYLLADPRQTILRLLGLVLFISIVSISNQQTYSFFSFATTGMMFMLVFFLLQITAHIPFSPSPEKVFMRLKGRYFHSSAYLMSVALDSSEPITRLEKIKMAFHSREVSTLPAKLSVWLPHLDSKVLCDTTSEQIQELVNGLQSLTYRLQELFDERGKQQSQLLVQKFAEDIHIWHFEVQNTFQLLGKDMRVTGKHKTLRVRLDDILERLEGNIKELSDSINGVQTISEAETENFYQLLGAYRGISEALVDYAGKVNAIDWSRWHEERFV